MRHQLLFMGLIGLAACASTQPKSPPPPQGNSSAPTLATATATDSSAASEHTAPESTPTADREHAPAHPAEPVHHAWNYEGATGPDHWGDLKADFSACKVGLEQSPIDLKWSKPIAGGKIAFKYNPSHLRVIDNGHTLQVNFDAGSQAEIRGELYDLLQMHYHAPSEHTLSGRFSPVELHFVHKSQAGKLAVVGVLVVEGKFNPTLNKILTIIPPVKNQEMQATDWAISAADLLPRKLSYYHYMGSLTTPPCSEGVNWNVLNTSIEASREQIRKMQALYRDNSRPTQGLHERPVKNY